MLQPASPESPDEPPTASTCTNQLLDSRKTLEGWTQDEAFEEPAELGHTRTANGGDQDAEASAALAALLPSPVRRQLTMCRVPAVDARTPGQQQGYDSK